MTSQMPSYSVGLHVLLNFFGMMPATSHRGWTIISSCDRDCFFNKSRVKPIIWTYNCLAWRLTKNFANHFILSRLLSRFSIPRNLPWIFIVRAGKSRWSWFFRRYCLRVFSQSSPVKPLALRRLLRVLKICREYYVYYVVGSRVTRRFGATYSGLAAPAQAMGRPGRPAKLKIIFI